MAASDSTPSFDLDDPDVVSNFINFIPKRMEDYASSCIKPSNVVSPSDEATNENENSTSPSKMSKEHPIEQDTTISTTPASECFHHESVSTSATATPAEGFRAPPPTPATIAIAIEKGAAHLETVPEDDILDKVEQSEESAVADAANSTVAKTNDTARADEPSGISPKTATILAFDAFTDKAGNQGLGSSKFAAQLSSTTRAHARPILSSRNPNTHRPKVPKTAKAANNAENLSEYYRDMVIEKFRKDAEANLEAGVVDFEKAEGSPAAEPTAQWEAQAPIQSPKQAPVQPFNFNVDAAQEFKPASHDRHVTFDITAAKVALADDEAPSETVPIKMEIVEEPIVAESNDKLSEDVAITVGDGQKDDNTTVFTSWVAPEARSAPRAEVRRVVLTGLPSAIDNSIVAGLMHGGSLESFTIVKASEGAAFVKAIVTFVTDSAAKRYYDKYPNGLVVKLNGKKYVATVEMGENVDVISGLMRGYIESGASRVVRAAGADEDWGMRDLRKMAEEKGRKVEAIIDTYKDESRTIEFRFTNIADAVAFRGHLTRDIDWEDCVISFGEDPCAKATGPRKD